MNQQKNRRKQRIKLTFTYAVMTLAVLALAVVCLMLVQGYRLDFDRGTVRQGTDKHCISCSKYLSKSKN